MAEIAYNKERLESILGDYTAAEKEAESIKEGINDSIAKIEGYWTGSDQVIGNRNRDFAKIKENLDSITSNLNQTTKYLNSKNSNFASASTKYDVLK